MAVSEGKITDQEFLVKDIIGAYRNQKFSDISFVLTDGVTIETNRFMLAIRSEYFAAMLFGGLKEGKNKEVALTCTSQIFRLLLDYMCEGNVDFSHLNLELLLDLMDSARLMCLDRFVVSIQRHISSLLESSTVDIGESLTALDFCVNYRFEELTKDVLKFVDSKFESISVHDKFSKLSARAIITILDNEDRTIEEIKLFNALRLWIYNQTTSVSHKTKDDMFNLIKLELIGSFDLLKVVRKSGFYADKAICDALEKQLQKEGENVCLAENGAELIEGIENRGSCIRNPPYTYRNMTGYSYNQLGKRITVELKETYMINKIQFKLWDLDDRTYSYILESSQDGSNWTTVLDCSEMSCSSLQTIYFPVKEVKFIAVKGTRNSFKKDSDKERHNFHIVSLLGTLDNSSKDRKNSGMYESLTS